MDFIGNSKNINFLNKSLQKDFLNHAYIFSGPEKVGKFTLAKMFALSAISEKEINPDVEQSDKNAMLDLILLEPEILEKNGISKQRNISIEAIRDVKQKLSLFPYHGKYKILIINDAHKLNGAAQNALLKILEEPNETSIIIFVTHELDRMLPTIISRCQTINFSLVNDQDLRKVLAINEKIVSLAVGRPGLAISMMENEEEYQFRLLALNQFDEITNGSLNDKFQLAEEFSKNIISTLEKLAIWIWQLRKNAQENECQRVQLYEKIERIEESINSLKSTNANGRLILETLLMSL